MERLKLIALDDTDLQVVSAHLQDAVCSVGDMAYQPAERRLVVLLNRFEWTVAAASGRPERRQAALRIERVSSAQVQGIDLSAGQTVLALLAITFAPEPEADKAPAGELLLQFAGHSAIRLRVECIELQLEDLGPAWQARSVPNHDRSSGGAADGSDRSEG